jgi:hypothetical protein
MVKSFVIVAKHHDCTKYMCIKKNRKTKQPELFFGFKNKHEIALFSNENDVQILTKNLIEDYVQRVLQPVTFINSKMKEPMMMPLVVPFTYDEAKNHIK